MSCAVFCCNLAFILLVLGPIELLLEFQDTFRSYYSHALALGSNKNLNIVCEIGPGGTDYAQLAAADLGVEMFDQVDVIPLRESFLDYETQLRLNFQRAFTSAKSARSKNLYNYFEDGVNSVRTRQQVFMISYFHIQCCSMSI